MKRVLSFLALLLLPLSLMAMTPIADSDLSKVTAQAGVSIELDMTMNISFGQLGWADPDAGGGWIGLDNLKMSTLHIWPRSDYTMENGATGDVTGTYPGDGGWAQLRMLTIDVVTESGDFDGDGTLTTLDHITKVRIGIPTLSITMKEMTGNVVLGPCTNVETIGGRVNGIIYAGKTINGPQFDQLMGRFYVGGLNMATGGGTVDIYAHGRENMLSAAGNGGPGPNGEGPLYGSGVTLTMNNMEISYLLIDKAAWGDLDGAFVTNGTTSTNGLNNAGWVGLAELAIKNIRINGSVLIDVATFAATGGNQISDWNAWNDILPAWDEIYTTTQAQGQNLSTFVQLSFDNMTISMEKMGARVVLNQDAAGIDGFTAPAAANDQILGDIYVGGMSLGITRSELTNTPSYVRIFAHN